MSGESHRHLFDIAFADSLDGWAVGYDDYMGGDWTYAIAHHTTDGGWSWEYSDAFESAGFVRKITFVDSLNGWAVGGWIDMGMETVIFHSSDGGANWKEQNALPGLLISNVTFTDTRNGWLVGWLAALGIGVIRGLSFIAQTAGQPGCNSSL